MGSGSFVKAFPASDHYRQAVPTVSRPPGPFASRWPGEYHPLNLYRTDGPKTFINKAETRQNLIRPAPP